jgi:uncharacterized membrane protein
MISNEPTGAERKLYRMLGILLIALGLVIAVCFRASYDTSVPGIHASSGIQGIGLLPKNRQDRIYGGIELCLIGGVILLSSKKST